MTTRPSHPAPLRRAPSQIPSFAAIAAGGSWTWAVALLATRHHLVGTYYVISAAPWLWGPVILPLAQAALILLLGILLTLLCLRYARTTGRRFPRPVACLLFSCLVPALDCLRLLAFPIPATFAEPLLLTAITAFAVGEMAAALPMPSPARRIIVAVPWAWVVWGVALAMGVWWYWQSLDAYNSFLLGFNDFGHFGQRVANTWAGRGFLMETPSLPPFWDHFNPGLALLAPLWGLWPDGRLFMLLQAVCLLLPAPILFGTARQLGATGFEAAMWAVAYLLYPPLSQLNLSFSYGWHPVSLALPLLFLALHCLLKGRRTGSLIAALFACSFQEDVVVTLGCLTAAMALQSAWARRKRLPPSQSGAVARRLPLWGWAALHIASVVAFLLIYQYSGLRQYQVSRFEKLGNSALEIIASPILRPAVFWGTVFRLETVCFIAALSVPLGWRALVRGRWILLACVLPLGVLVAWGHQPATSFAFQYTTTLLPVLFLAAMSGGCRTEPLPEPDPVAGPLWRASATALAGCAAASLWLGSSPWCCNTLTEVAAQSYAFVGLDLFEHRSPGSPGIEALHRAVARVDRENASVLATGRIAAHFVGAKRLDTVGQAPQRWAAFELEAGPGRSGIELFEWLLIDTYERFQQSENDIAFVLNHARQAGYLTIEAHDGILVLRRPEKRRSSD